MDNTDDLIKLYQEIRYLVVGRARGQMIGKECLLGFSARL